MKFICKKCLEDEPLEKWEEEINKLKKETENQKINPIPTKETDNSYFWGWCNGFNNAIEEIKQFISNLLKEKDEKIIREQSIWKEMEKRWREEKERNEELEKIQKCNGKDCFLNYSIEELKKRNEELEDKLEKYGNDNAKLVIEKIELKQKLEDEKEENKRLRDSLNKAIFVSETKIFEEMKKREASTGWAECIELKRQILEFKQNLEKERFVRRLRRKFLKKRVCDEIEKKIFEKERFIYVSVEEIKQIIESVRNQ